MKRLICTAIILAMVIVYFENKSQETDLNQEWNLILVNDYYYLPEEYTVDLWELQNGEKIDARIYPYLQEMMDAAEEDNIYMCVADGYRSMEMQQEVMKNKVLWYVQDGMWEPFARMKAKRWVAEPGTSEHHLGLAVDLNAEENNSTWEVYNWLAYNAYEYGFIQRYPEDKTRITGINYEPWHYRFVGIEAATEIYEKDICLEEYLDSLK